jgi:hypothetical protein
MKTNDQPSGESRSLLQVPKPKATRPRPKPARAQVVVEAIERWKKCTMATFGLLALLIAIIVVLIIELGAVKRVWGETFPTAPISSPLEKPPH